MIDRLLPSMATRTNRNAPKRPDRIAYYLGAAVAIAARAECKGQHVGAVIVGAGNRVLSTGYNGAPEGWGNCSDGGVCPRCDKRERFGSGEGYDKCICVHAEMNAISAAARYGMSLDGATAYVTHQPCFTCAKEMIQAGIARVYYAIALPVREREDVPLAATEARLLGALQAIHVQDASQLLSGLQGALDRFQREASSSAVKPKADEVSSHVPTRGSNGG